MRELILLSLGTYLDMGIVGSSKNCAFLMEMGEGGCGYTISMVFPCYLIIIQHH